MRTGAVVAVIFAILIVAAASALRAGSGGAPIDPTAPDGVSDQPAPVGKPNANAGIPAIDRLRDQLAHFESNIDPVESEDLARARAWVNAHRPADRPFNELEAGILALLDATHGDAPNAAWEVINASRIEIETLAAIDIDGDGRLTDDEITAFLADENAAPDPLYHPYFEDGFDNEAALVAVLKRAQLEAWDTDRDGSLSSHESDIGLATEREARVQFLVDRELEGMELAGLFEENLDRDQHEAELRARFTESLAGVDLTQAALLTAENLLFAMKLADLSDDAVGRDFSANLPIPPDFESFDANGDGDIDEVENAAFNRASQSYEQMVEAMRDLREVDFYHNSFNHASSMGDLNRDGRLSPAEWEALIDKLVVARDQRLFHVSYDLDRDGSVSDTELSMLMGWHAEGSLRADVNYDGQVDARDLQDALTRFTRQNQ